MIPSQKVELWNNYSSIRLFSNLRQFHNRGYGAYQRLHTPSKHEEGHLKLKLDYTHCYFTRLNPRKKGTF